MRLRALTWFCLPLIVVACGGDDAEPIAAAPGAGGAVSGHGGGSGAGNAGGGAAGAAAGQAGSAQAGGGAAGASGQAGGTQAGGGQGGKSGKSGAAGAAGGGFIGGAGTGGAPIVVDLPAKCSPVTPWAPGTKIFEEATSKWGLDGVVGVRLNVADVDGDGHADLAVRRGGNGADDFASPEKRQTWLLRSDGAKFTDITESSGLRARRTPGATPTEGRPGEVFAFGDVDNDGDLDVYTGLTADPKKPGTETSELLLNDGKGNFTLGSAALDLRLDPGKDVPAGASFVDYDRDGNLDLWVTQNSIGATPQQDRLYRGDGKGGFMDMTVDAGLKTLSWVSAKAAELNGALGHSNAWSAAACDLDGDGNPELLAASYGRAPNLLFRGKADHTFDNVSLSSGYAYDDNQDWRDNESARCWCKLHPADDDCAGVPPPKYIACKVDSDAFRWQHSTDRNAYRLGGNSGATVCADVDNDGRLDLLTSEIMHWDVGGSSDRSELLLNRSSGGALLFQRPGNAAMGLSRTYPSIGFDEGIMTASALDFDNDGRLDLYLGGSDYPDNRGLLFHQKGDGTFEAVPLADGVDHHRSHGSVVADFDRDGDLDLVVGHSRARCGSDPDDSAECYPTSQVRFFENKLGGSFVQVRLVGAQGTNRAAIGARVEAQTDALGQVREVDGGHGHYGNQDDAVLHFGLGGACQVDVTVRWPDAAGTVERYRLPAGYRFVLEQGKAPKAD